MAYSKGTWKQGFNYASVVTDDGEGFPNGTGHDDVDQYGGFLIGESIMKEDDRKLISAAPDLFDACVQFVSAMQRDDQEELANALISANKAILKAQG